MDKPKIRFKGYTDAWEQRKLIDVCDYVDYRGKTPTKMDRGIFLVTAKNVKAGYIDYESSKEYISEEDYEEVMHRGKPEIGDVLITTEAPCGNVAQVNSNNVALAQRIIKYRGHENVIDNAYLKHYMLAPFFQKVLFEKSSGGTVQGIKGSTLHQQYVIYPQYDEQVKIGQYFDSLDALITLHQRKCEQTQKLKKYMLQKMFPQNGENVPEIRFDGFADAWEQRKLSDVAEFGKGGGYSKGDLEEAGTPIILYGRLYTKYETSIRKVDTFVSPKKGSVYSQGGEVIVPASGETAEDIARASTVENAGIILGGDLNVIKPKDDISPAFLALSISNGKSQKELAQKAQGKSIVHIHNEEIKALVVPFPTRQEQDKIVEQFSTLDHLITLHQRKCAELQNIKKFMLQNMFV
jgi:type I restriction enzyme S subunit